MGKNEKALSVALGIVTLLGVVSFEGFWFYDFYHALPSIITEFEGLTLGDSLADATFKLGIPDTGPKANSARPLHKPISVLPAARPVESEITVPPEKLGSSRRPWFNDEIIDTNTPGGMESVMFGSFSITAMFRNGKLETISYSCKLNERDYTSINGISCGNRGDQIVKKFGSDVRVLCRVNDKQKGPWSSYERLGRAYDVVKYGTRYHLNQNVVTNLAIASPENLESYVGIDWEKCG